MRITPMNIVFASDKGYAEHLAVAMCSLFENNQGFPLDVYIVNSDIDELTWRRLALLAKQYDQALIDIKITDHDIDGLVTGYHFTKANYYRLFIPDKISANKALYLDSDIVVNGPIKDLYDMEIGDYYLAAIVNPGFDRHKDLDMSPESKYFNSGVMLLNLAMWRRNNIKNRVIDFVKMRPWAIQFVDQCGLNSVVNGRWKEIHPKYNLQGCFFEASANTYSGLFPEGDLEMAVHNPIIVHYSGTSKPWHFRNRHPYRSIYWDYLQMTSFSHLFSEDMTVLNVIKMCIPSVLKELIKRIFLRHETT